MAILNSDGYRDIQKDTAENYSINVTGKYVTVQAYRGDDEIIVGKISWTRNNMVFAGSGADNVTVKSDATVNGGNGSADTLKFNPLQIIPINALITDFSNFNMFINENDSSDASKTFESIFNKSSEPDNVND